MDRIFFEEKFKTFKIHCGGSLYCFCITPELSLQHLYFGDALPPGYDLRYLSLVNRSTAFLTKEYTASPKGHKSDIIIPKHETLDELAETWRIKAQNIDIEDKRKENIAWRLKTMNAIHQTQSQSQSQSHKITQKNETNIPTARSSPDLLSPGIPSDFAVEKNNARSSSPTTTRMMNRIQSASNLSALYIPEASDLFSSPPKSTHRRRVYDRSYKGNLGKGQMCLEYSDQGTGDYRSPSFIVIDNFQGCAISPLRYKSHHIVRGKEKLPSHLPALRLDERDATTLTITMQDKGSGLEVDLIYVAMHNYDAITRRVVFRNIDNRDYEKVYGKVIERAFSSTIDMEASNQEYHIVKLCGSWARERYIVETKITHGMNSFASTRGVSGHQHNPFVAVTIGEPNECSGEALGFSLLYSGNHSFEVQMNEMGRVRVNCGINPEGFSWFLCPFSEFYTPEVIIARSSNGLGSLSRTFHRLFNYHLIPKITWAVSNPPVLLNTWETLYFDVNHSKILDMSKKAATMGIDLIVIDDGWFSERSDDTSSLGDWFENKRKFPNGLKAVADDVNELGLKLGLWLEPECISVNSELFQNHPDWCLRLPARQVQVGRNQLVLDLSRNDVRQYLIQTIKDILDSANIAYIKWDMNRPLSEVFSQRFAHNPRVHPQTKPDAGPDFLAHCCPQNDEEFDAQLFTESLATNAVTWQAETSHRYVLGLYEILDEITKAYPNLLIETCSSGGGRFDPGMLYFSSMIWCSDNTDASSRLKIQYGSSLLYPIRSMGCHVSQSPNHITGAATSARTRGFVALSGCFGFELDLSETSDEDNEIFRSQIKLFKEYHPIIHWGDFYRLWSPFEVNYAAWMFVKRDKTEALIFAFNLNSDHWSILVPRLHCQGLIPEYDYEITEPIPNNVFQASSNLRIERSDDPIYQLGYKSIQLSGAILMKAGLPIKFFTLDDSVLFHLKATNTIEKHRKSSK